jgi:YbbR domain-containing protein
MTWLRTSGPRLFLAFVLSFALWAYVSFNENPDTSTSFDSMPVVVQNLPDGLVIVDQNGVPRPDQTHLAPVSVVVKTDQKTLRGLRQSDLRAFADLSGLPPGESQVEVNIEPAATDVRLSSFSSILVDPEFQSVRLDVWITRTIPLTINVQGNLPFSFERGEPEARVNGTAINRVEVRGPQNQAKRVSHASTVANIEQLRASYISLQQLVAVDRSSEPVAGVELKPSLVNVRVPIRSVVGLKRVPVLGMIEGSPAPGYVVKNIQSDPPLVNISGSSGRLDTIEKIETEPIAIEGATTTLTREVELAFPPGISSDLNENTHVLVTIQIEPLERPFHLRLPFPVEVTAVPPGIEAQVTPRVLPIALVGSAQALARLDTTTLVATVSANGFGPGLYDLTPRLSLPEGIRVAGEVPSVQVALGVSLTPSPTPTIPLSPTTAPLPTPPLSPTTPLSPTESLSPTPMPMPDPTAPLSSTISLSPDPGTLSDAPDSPGEPVPSPSPSPSPLLPDPPDELPAPVPPPDQPGGTGEE